MLLPSIYLKKYPTKGLGLCASTFIPAGTIIWGPCQKCTYYSQTDLRNQSEESFNNLNELGYTMADKGMLLPCDNACYMNHACNANVLDHGLDFGVAVRDIHPFDEVCCDYHTWEGETFEMQCRCSALNCRLTISPKLRDAELTLNWTTQIRAVLEKITQLPQPLHERLLTSSDVYLKLLQGNFNYQHDQTISVKTIRKH